MKTSTLPSSGPLADFISRHSQKAIGVLEGFDRVWVQATLRTLYDQSVMEYYRGVRGKPGLKKQTLLPEVLRKKTTLFRIGVRKRNRKMKTEKFGDRKMKTGNQ